MITIARMFFRLIIPEDDPSHGFQIFSTPWLLRSTYIYLTYPYEPGLSTAFFLQRYWEQVILYAQIQS
jgi:hypothetical protein